MSVLFVADHRPLTSQPDALLLLAIPVLWLIGVVLFIVFKFRAH